MHAHASGMSGLRLRPLGIDTLQEHVIYMRRDCPVCRAEGFEAQTRVEAALRDKRIIATLNVVDSDLLSPDEASLSTRAWQALGAAAGNRGLVPAAVVSQKHALEEMHGVVPKEGGQIHHLVVALFDAQGNRIEDAIVRAQLDEVGIVDAPPKYLTPMPVAGQASYGQQFSTAKNGPYRLRVFVKLPSRAADIEFAVSARSLHREAR